MNKEIKELYDKITEIFNSETVQYDPNSDMWIRQLAATLYLDNYRKMTQFVFKVFDDCELFCDDFEDFRKKFECIMQKKSAKYLEKHDMEEIKYVLQVVERDIKEICPELEMKHFQSRHNYVDIFYRKGDIGLNSFILLDYPKENEK